jgi:integrase
MTIKSSRYALRNMCDQLGNPWLHLVTDEQMDRYCYGPKGLKAGKRGKPIQASSFNRYLADLKTFYSFAQLMNWVDVSPMRTVKLMREDRAKRHLLLSASELMAMLDACQSPVERIGCALGMNTGLRSNDIRHLTIGDVSLAAGIIQTAIRKSRDFDDKEITADLAVELIRWLDEYAKLTGVGHRGNLPNEWYLMPVYKKLPPLAVKDGNPFKLFPTRMYTVPWRLVQRPLERIGHDVKGEGFHTLRRSSARLFFERLRDRGEGRDHALMIVRDYLGHASVVMTERYLGLSAERAIRTKELKGQSFISAMAQQEQERLSGSENGDESREGLRLRLGT